MSMMCNKYQFKIFLSTLGATTNCEHQNDYIVMKILYDCMYWAFNLFKQSNICDSTFENMNYVIQMTLIVDVTFQYCYNYKESHSFYVELNCDCCVKKVLRFSTCWTIYLPLSRKFMNIYFNLALKFKQIYRRNFV